jgi:hypothetical protein
VSTIFFTSILSNYLSRALLLAQSVILRHSDACFRIYLYDYEDLARGSLDSLLALLDPACRDRISFYSSRACLPLFSQFDNRFTVVEACTAVKPFIAKSLLEGHACVVYLDPDCYVYSSLYNSSDSFSSASWSLQLTPHTLSPALSMPLSERIFLSYGVFNLGYFAVKPTAEALAFLDWWSYMVDFYGVDSPSSGNFVDQKPLDLAPAFISNLDIVRSPGWNVAWWNLFCDGRRVQADHTVSFGGAVCQLVFFHFSNIDRSLNPLVARPLRELIVDENLCRLSTYPLLSTLYDDYLSSLDKLNQDVGRLVAFARPSVGLGSRGRFARLVNSELYRLVSAPGLNSATAPSYQKFSSYHLVAKVILLLYLSSKAGIGVRKNFVRRLRRFASSLFGPTLYDYTSTFR